MDNNRVKGTIDEVVGVAKQKTGELIGNPKLQVEGIAQQVKGKIESAWGQAKDAVHETNEEAAVKPEPLV
jgi:uncharacterized protein YjbJ (UPF0337 family)